jgi:hypothetical protein
MAFVRFKSPVRRRPGSGPFTAAGKSARARISSSRLAANGFGASGSNVGMAVAAIAAGALAVYSIIHIHDEYTFSLQPPVVVHVQSPLVIAHRSKTDGAKLARLDQFHPLSAYQQYACREFGSACRVALAIQRAENPQGKCEIYHYNADGTLDWGYFQINTVHLKRRGVNLRDLLDCKANIDFAFQLYTENHGFTPWAAYNNGAYRKFLRD